MITLTNGSVQTAGGVVAPNGYLVLQLTQDCTLIASPATVVKAIPVQFRFDASGNLSGSCKIYSNAELQPGTQYQVRFLDANKSPISDPMLWQFTQASGTTVDIGTMTAVGAGVSFPAPIVSNPGAAQTITGFDLQLASASLVIDSARAVKWGSSGILTPDVAIWRLAAKTLGIGSNTPGDFSGTLRTAIYQIGAADTGLSRDAAGVVDVGNGTQGDTTGKVRAANFIAGLNASLGSSGDMSAARSATSGYLFLGSDGLKAIGRDTGANIDMFGFNSWKLYGSSSGSTTVQTSAAASGTLTLPAATGTLALGTPNKQIFTGNGTFTIPAGVTAVKVSVTGGGGGGGGSTAGTAGGGGGGGATAIKWLTGLTPGNTIAVTVGGGGGSNSNATGGSGGNSTIASGTQSITTVTGGGGGGGTNSKTPGSGGTATNGDINSVGGDGTFGLSGSQGGTGGASLFGGGARGALAFTGVNAGNYGGGGGGSEAGPFGGGTGGGGIVVFEWVT